LYDPNSERSKAFRGIIEKKFPDVAKSYGDNWNQVSAIDQDSIFRPLQLKENIESRKQQAQMSSQSRKDSNDDRDFQRELLKEEKQKLLQVPGFEPMRVRTVRRA